MEKMNALTLIITLTVGIFLTGSILMPVLGEYTPETKTILNDGVDFKLADSDDANTHTIVLGSDDNGAMLITFDGEQCKLPDFTLFGSASVLFAQGSFIRLASNGALTLYGSNGSQTFGNVSLGNILSSDVTVSITGTTATVSTYSIQNVQAYISNAGTYVLAKTPHVLKDSVVYSAALNAFGGSSVGIVVYGALDDLSSNAVYPSGRSVGEITVNTTNVATNLYKLDSIDAECLNSAEEQMGIMYISYLLAPKEITYDNPGYMGQGNTALLSAIPILIIISIVVTAAGMVYIGRKD